MYTIYYIVYIILKYILYYTLYYMAGIKKYFHILLQLYVTTKVLAAMYYCYLKQIGQPVMSLIRD